MTLCVKIFVALVTIVVSTTQYDISDITNGRIETCRGCSLNRLPEVKNFVLNDAPKYDRLAVEFITGAKPELVLLGAGDAELERLPLSSLSRAECNKLLEDKGFETRSDKTHADL